MAALYSQWQELLKVVIKKVVDFQLLNRFVLKLINPSGVDIDCVPAMNGKHEGAVDLIRKEVCEKGQFIQYYWIIHEESCEQKVFVSSMWSKKWLKFWVPHEYFNAPITFLIKLRPLKRNFVCGRVIYVRATSHTSQHCRDVKFKTKKNTVKSSLFYDLNSAIDFNILDELVKQSWCSFLLHLVEQISIWKTTLETHNATYWVSM